MNEMIDQMAFLLGLIVVVGVPLSIIVAVLHEIYLRLTKKPTNSFDMQRQEYNLEILRLVKKYVKDHPEQRLGQILLNVNILMDVGVKDSSRPNWETPDYYIDRRIVHEESCIILDRVKKTLRIID